MKPFDAFRYYMSIKLHFDSPTYDAIKYNFKTNTNMDAFLKRRDKYYFAKIGKKFSSKEDLIGFYVSHFISSDFSKKSVWIGNMVNNIDSNTNYSDWKKRNQSITYIFQKDIIKLLQEFDSFDDLFSINGNYPVIINKYLQEEISIETVSILNRFTNFLDRVEIKETLLYPQIKMRIKKYESFIKFDSNKIKAIILDNFKS